MHLVIRGMRTTTWQNFKIFSIFNELPISAYQWTILSVFYSYFQVTRLFGSHLGAVYQKLTFYKHIVKEGVVGCEEAIETFFQLIKLALVDQRGAGGMRLSLYLDPKKG